MAEWIDVHDALPEIGEWVLIHHTYRIPEYGTPIALGQRVCFHGSKNAAWVWVAGKCHSTEFGQRDTPLEWLAAHTLKPGDRYVTHWQPLPATPEQGKR